MVSYEVDFLAVGKGERSGDAIALRYEIDGNYTIHVVDGGDEASGSALVSHINAYYGRPWFVDHVVLTHADDDHSSGLLEVIRSFAVGAIWMNRPWLYAAEIVHLFRDSRFTVSGLERRLKEDYPILIEIDQIAAARGIPVYEVFQGAQIGSFSVLSPTRQRYLELIPQFSRTPEAAQAAQQGLGVRNVLAQTYRATVDWIFETWGRETLEEDVETTASNESSVVQLADLSDHKLLLTGDAGVQSLHEAANFAEMIGFALPGLRFMQVPHHGSRHNVSPSVLNRWLGQPVPRDAPPRCTAFASVAANDRERPRKKVVNAFTRRGAPVHVAKGVNKRHSHNMPDRDGWVRSEPLEFSERVEP
jgi:beta-lactamase superfamily II metal-dependent hydrolase